MVVPVYMVANMACIGYYAGTAKRSSTSSTHIVVPIIGFGCLLPGFMSAAGITGVPGLKFIVALSSPYSYAAVRDGRLDGRRRRRCSRAARAQSAAVAAVAQIHFEDDDMVAAMAPGDGK